MKVKHGYDHHVFEQAMTVKRLLKVLEIVPEGVVVTVNGDLVTTDATARVGDEVEIIRAISGGVGASA